MQILVGAHGGPCGLGLVQQDPATALARASVLELDEVRASRAALKGRGDMRPWMHAVWNQGNSSTCWAHSGEAGLYVRRNALGLSPTVQSPLYFAQIVAAYYRSKQAPKGDLPVLADDGAQLDDADREFARWGSQPKGAPQQDGDTDVPATSDDEGNPIPLPELKAINAASGFAKPFAGGHDVAVDEGAMEVVAACVDAGIPVWLGGLVGQATMDLEAGQLEKPTAKDDPTAGGHARLVLGYRTATANGVARLEPLILNSWGPKWCDAGYSWAEPGVVTSAWSLQPFTGVS
jgi:C1A family cysteine protease